MSRLLIGGNLMGGCAHSRDLMYASQLFKEYNTEAKVIETLEAQGGEDIPILVGGLIPEDDKPVLQGMGVAQVFTAGTPISSIASFIESRIANA